MSKLIFLQRLCLVLSMGLAAAAALPASAADPAVFTVTATSAFLRDAPSPQAPVTYSVFQGQAFAVLGRTDDNGWMQLDYPRAKKGTWILATLGQVTGNLASVPVIEASAGVTVTSSGPITPTAIGLTPTPGSTAPSEICVLLYQDTNGNGRQDSNETALGGGQLTILDTGTGAVLQTYTTATRETHSHCFKDLQAGAYTVAATAPPGYNTTSAGSLLLQTRAGEHYELTFGAQPGASTRASGQNNIVAILGSLGIVVLLLAAAIAALMLMRRK